MHKSIVSFDEQNFDDVRALLNAQATTRLEPS
jgi:hypothetical protein